MAGTTNIFIASLLLLCILQEGHSRVIVNPTSECSLSNILVSQSKTGQQIQGNPEYQVTVVNNCICTQSSVLLSCSGFSSAETVDPSIFRPNGDGKCILNNGQPVTQDSPVKFKYAPTASVNLTPASSTINCS